MCMSEGSEDQERSLQYCERIDSDSDDNRDIIIITKLDSIQCYSILDKTKNI
jgi:hypothetical protein